MKQLINASASDFKLIFRDASLRIFLFVPVLAILVAAWFLPNLVEKYEMVSKYVPYVLMAATLQTSTMFGFIYCMVLIEEKETGVNKIYGVLPITKKELISYRLIFPTLFSAGITFILLYLQPFYQLPLYYNGLISMLTALLGPILALLIGNLSRNKMQGLTYYKAFNGLLNLPLLAFFIPDSYGFLFGFIPSHWIFQEINNFIFGKPLYLNLSIGYVFCVGLLIYLIYRFSRKHFV